MVVGGTIPKKYPLTADDVAGVIGPEPEGEGESRVYRTLMNKMYGLLDKGIDAKTLKGGIKQAIDRTQK